MSLLSSPQDCCNPCPTATTTNVPGTPGADGADGAAGADGVNAYTTVNAPFTMPAEAATVDVTVVESAWMVAGQKVFIGVTGGGARGTFEVVAILSATLVTLLNVADVAAGQYVENSPAGTVFPVASAVGPSGLQGASGAAGGGGAVPDATYVTRTPTAGGALPNETALSAIGTTGLLHVTTGTGALAVKPVGTALGNIAPVDSAAGLVPGECVFATAAGVRSLQPLAAQAALALGSMARQGNLAVDIRGGTIVLTDVSGPTGLFLTFTAGTANIGVLALSPTALQTLAAANVITPSGKVRVVGNGGAVTMTSTPTMALGTIDGEVCLVVGEDDTNTVTLQDNGSLAGSKLRLGAASRVLGAGDSVLFSWSGARGMWEEASYTALV